MVSHIDPAKVAAAARGFMLPASPIDAAPYGNGHINDTFQVSIDAPGEGPGGKGRVILQRINTKIFRDPERLMENISKVITHQHRKLAERGEAEVERKVLTLFPAREGGYIHRDPEGGCWRASVFIERVASYDVVTREKQAFEAAKAFGTFLKDLSDLPGQLHETIPDFHHTPKRFQQLEKAIHEDTAKRSRECIKEIDAALGWKRMADRIIDHLAEDKLSNRVTHNDTKVNNVLMDTTTGNGMCVIDLDTVMPGNLLYDFGDMVRTTTSPVAEDDEDHNRAVMRRHLYDELVRGFTKGADGILTPLEVELLPYSGVLITVEMGIRFLADYLNGDTYYKVYKKEHNLLRTRTQLKLAKSIAEQLAVG